MLPYIAGSAGESIAYAVWGQSDYFTAMGAALLIARPLMLRFGPKNVVIFAYLYRELQPDLVSPPHSSCFLNTIAKTDKKPPSTFGGLRFSCPFPSARSWVGGSPTKWGTGAYCSSFLFLPPCLLREFSGPCLPTGRIRSIPLFISHHPCLTLQEFFDVGLLSDLSSRFPILWWLFFASALLAWFFWYENGRSNNPLVRFSLFTHPNYAFGMLILSLAFMCFQAAIVEYILRLQGVEGYTAWHVGLIFLPLFVFSKPLSILASNLIHKGYDPRFLACISLITFAISFWWISGYIRPASWEELLWPQFLEGAALGLFFVPMTAVALSHVPKNLNGTILPLLILPMHGASPRCSTIIIFRTNKLVSTHLYWRSTIFSMCYLWSLLSSQS